MALMMKPRTPTVDLRMVYGYEFEVRQWVDSAGSLRTVVYLRHGKASRLEVFDLYSLSPSERKRKRHLRQAEKWIETRSGDALIPNFGSELERIYTFTTSSSI